MATCKIMRRNFAMKIGLSKEGRLAKDRKGALVGEKSSFFHKQPVALRSSSEMFNPSLVSQKRKENSSYWNDLSQSKVALREKNREPLRAIRTAMYGAKPTSIAAAASSGKINATDCFTSTIKRVFGPCNDESTDEEIVPHRSAVATLAANRRLLKSSNGFNIFLNRRFGSSASSSCCSLFRRHDDRRRLSNCKRTFRGGFAGRAYNTQTSNTASASQILNSSSPKYIISMRNQNMSLPLGSVSQAVQVSSKIQQELMPVDKTLRERISMKNTYVTKQHHESKDPDPMCGWHHPPSPDMLSARILERLSEKRTVPSISNKAQEASLRTPNRKERLDMQCKLMSEGQCTAASPLTATGVAAASISKKVTIPQLSTPLTCENGVSSEPVTTRQMVHLTARRLANVEHHPIRRFSLRRPPKSSLSEKSTPAPGPAAESLLQQYGKNITPSTMSSLAFAHNQSRYNRLSGRVPQKLNSI